MPPKSQQQTYADFTVAHLIPLPTIPDDLGNLTFIAANETIPFPIKRVYYIYDIPPDASRGGHAHKTNQEIIVALAGAFTVTLETQDGTVCRNRLDRPDLGLYIPALHWRVLDDYAAGSVCLVLASKPYNPKDYLRDYAEFQSYSGAGE